jgi:predicted kinase
MLDVVWQNGDIDIWPDIAQQFRRRHRFILANVAAEEGLSVEIRAFDLVAIRQNERAKARAAGKHDDSAAQTNASRENTGMVERLLKVGRNKSPVP